MIEHTKHLHDELIEELDSFLTEQEKLYPDDEVLNIDLHCHDHNSDVPDELLLMETELQDYNDHSTGANERVWSIFLKPIRSSKWLEI